ncbi:MAG: GNAT family N-acetyltransferase [Gaiellales bacterium]
MGELRAFTVEAAETVAAWVISADEAARWGGVLEHPVRPAILAAWHAEPGVVPFLLVDSDEPVGYGELWEDEGEAELARLVVDPERRGRGLGRELVEGLVEEARRRNFDEIWIRVVPENEPAIRCYRNAGFVRTSVENETAFNEGQPRVYQWMRHGGA